MKTHRKAFTLVEILVVIAVIGILALWASRLNFSRISQLELLNIESIKMLSSIEEARNNALVGRVVSAWWEAPESWRIVFDVVNDSYTTEYVQTSGTPESVASSKLRSPFEISAIVCKWIDKTALWNIANSGNITFYTNGQTTIDWCSHSDARLVDIEIWFWSKRKTLRINTITNVIEEI